MRKLRQVDGVAHPCQITKDSHGRRWCRGCYLSSSLSIGSLAESSTGGTMKGHLHKVQWYGPLAMSTLSVCEDFKGEALKSTPVRINNMKSCTISTYWTRDCTPCEHQTLLLKVLGDNTSFTFNVCICFNIGGRLAVYLVYFFLHGNKSNAHWSLRVSSYHMEGRTMMTHSSMFVWFNFQVQFNVTWWKTQKLCGELFVNKVG